MYTPNIASEIMDAPRVASEIEGFMMAQMMMGQAKPAAYSFATLRFDRDFELFPMLREAIVYAFQEGPSPHKEISMELNNKFELEVYEEPRMWGTVPKPILVFPMCFHIVGAKDILFTIALRNETGLPMSLNVLLFRNLLFKLKEKKINYEFW